MQSLAILAQKSGIAEQFLSSFPPFDFSDILLSVISPES
jgi:hypothetical protein